MWLRKWFDAGFAIFNKHREIILYLIFGGLATLISAVTYFLASWGLNLSAWLSSVVSWTTAVIFAYITNRAIVFQSKTSSKQGVAKEAVMFLAARLSSLALNVAIMYVFVDVMNLNETLFFVIAQIVVIVFNYIASKLLVFRKGEP